MKTIINTPAPSSQSRGHGHSPLLPDGEMAWCPQATTGDKNPARPPVMAPSRSEMDRLI
jgi:hypothetical protein